MPNATPTTNTPAYGGMPANFATPTATDPSIGGATPAYGGMPANFSPSTTPQPVAPATGGYVAPLVSSIKSGASDVAKAITTPTTTANEGLGGFFNSIKSTFSDAVTQLNQNVDEWGSSGILGKTDALGETMLLPLNVLFSPITASLQSVQGVPVVGQLADGLNRIFSTIGAAGGATASTAIQALPIPQSAKDTIMPLVKQLGALAAQVVVGDKGGDMVSSLDDMTGGHGADVIKAAKNTKIGQALSSVSDTVKNNSVGQAVGKIKGALNSEVVPSSLTSKTPSIPNTSEALNKAKELVGAINDAIQHPETEAAIGKQHAAYTAPAEKADFSTAFKKSAANPEITGKINSGKAEDMHPTLRGEIRDSLAAHGNLVTHGLLKDQLGAGDRQAAAHIREAGVPQNEAEEMKLHQNALRGAVGAKNVSPDGMRVVTKETTKNEDQPVLNKNSSETAQKDEEKPVSKTEPKPAEEAPKPFEQGVGESKVGKSIEAKAIEQGLTKRFEKTASYDPKTVKDQISRVSEFIGNNLDDARAVARGEKPVPEGMSSTMLLRGLEEVAKNTKDVDLQHELANSKLTSETSTHAQEQRFAQEREPDSATARLQEIKKTMEKKVGDKQIKATRSAVTKGAKSVEGKIHLAKDDQKWDSFLSSIKC